MTPSNNASEERSPTFESFKVPAFRVIWLGTYLYYLAIFSGIVARGGLAKKLGGDNSSLGLVTLAFGLVSLVMTPIGGVLADRISKRNILVFSTSLLSISSGALGLAEVLDVTRFWMLVAVSAIQAVAFATLVPARMAYTVEIVGPELIPNAVALAQISMNINRVIGPGLAASFIAVSWLGYAGIYLFSTVLSLASVVCFMFLGPGHPDPNRPTRDPVQELRDGVRYANSLPSLRLVIMLAIAVTMAGFPYIAFLPSVSVDFYDKGDLGFAALSLVGAVGGLVAGLLVARSVLSQGPKIQVISGLVLAVSLMLMGLAPTYETALLVSLVVGGSTAAFQSMNATLALSMSEPAYHGRVQSLLGLGFSAFGLVSWPLGMIADTWGLRQTLVGMGVTVLVVVVGGELTWRRHR